MIEIACLGSRIKEILLKKMRFKWSFLMELFSLRQ